MIKDDIAFISNFFWKSSIDNINKTLSCNQISNFNMNDYYYLTIIYQLGNPNLGEVAKALNLTKPSVSALVKRLIKSDLIIKKQSDVDKRIQYISLSEKGLKIMHGDESLYEDLENHIKSILTYEQFENINCLFNFLIEKIRLTNKESL